MLWRTGLDSGSYCRDTSEKVMEPLLGHVTSGRGSCGCRGRDRGSWGSELLDDEPDNP